MLDYGVETEYSLKGELLTRKLEEFDSFSLIHSSTTNVIHHSISVAKSLSPNVTHCVIKVTGVCPVLLLERISELLLYTNEFPETKNQLLPKSLNIEGYVQKKTPSFLLSKESPPKPLNDEELKELDITFKRLFKIGDECVFQNIPMLVDAEHSNYQGAIDLFFMILSLKYNKENAIFCNTYQMYLKDSFTRLTFDHQFLTSQGLKFGTKLVRGACKFNQHST
jgi:hypothetical protein